MLARVPRPSTRGGKTLLVSLVTLLILVILIALIVPLASTAKTVGKPPTSTTLLDRARLGTWSLPAQSDPPLFSFGYQGTDKIGGFQESDFLYTNGKYYLFSTASQEPAWIDVYVADTPEGLVNEPPTFTHVAPIRYPTAVKDGSTWNIWGVDPGKKRTEHWTSSNVDPTGFTYSDSPFSEPNAQTMVDFAVRKNPMNGSWYGVGFETWDNSPLLLARAPSANGPWEKLNYVESSQDAGVFGDTGAPPWANASRPDPNLAFTSDGRAWILFTGKPKAPQPDSVLWRGGMVQVSLRTGKAIGNPVLIFDHLAHLDWPFDVASDLNLVSVPGQPDRIFAETSSADYPLAVLSFPTVVTPTDGRTSADLVRLNTSTGFDVATGMSPTLLLPPYKWSSDGLVVSGNNGGVAGYLASSYLADFTFRVDFTPSAINPSAINAVAHIGGLDYDSEPNITVQIDATASKPLITAQIMGSDQSSVILNSGVVAEPNDRYSVVVSREGSAATLEVNGNLAAHSTEGAVLSGLQGWSLGTEATMTGGARYPFQGVIHAFVVTGKAPAPRPGGAAGR